MQLFIINLRNITETGGSPTSTKRVMKLSSRRLRVIVPVMKEAAGEAKNATTWPISEGSP